MKRIAWDILTLAMVICAPLSGRTSDVSSLVTLVLSDCGGVSPDEADRIIDLELQSIAAGHREMAARPIVVSVTCAPGRLALVAADNASDRRADRVIQIDTRQSEGMERIIAIAAAELVLSTWEVSVAAAEDLFSSNGHVAPRRSSDARSPADAPSAPKRQVTANRSQRAKAAARDPDGQDSDAERSKQREYAKGGRFGFSAYLGPVWRMFVSSRVSLFGGELGGEIRFPRLFLVHVGVAPEGGWTDRELGRVTIFSVSGVLSLGLAERLFESPLRGGVDIGFRGGYGRLKGRAHPAVSVDDELSGGFGGPLLRLSLASITRPAIALSVETGYAAFGLTGEVGIGHPVEMAGPWISARLAAAF